MLILPQPLVPEPGEPESPLHHPEHMFHLRSHPRLAPVPPTLLFRQRSIPLSLPMGKVLSPRRPLPDHLALTPIRRVSPRATTPPASANHARSPPSPPPRTPAWLANHTALPPPRGPTSSKNLIYAIVCQRCQMLYIGETKTALSTRFSDHLRSIRSNHSKIQSPWQTGSRTFQLHWPSYHRTRQNNRYSIYFR